MPKVNLPQSGPDSFLKGIKDRKAKYEATMAGQQPEDEKKEDDVVPEDSTSESEKELDKPVIELKPEVPEERMQTTVEEDSEKGANSESPFDEVVPMPVTVVVPSKAVNRTLKPTAKVEDKPNEELISRTVRLYPSQIRALKQLTLQDGPYLDKQISEVFREAINMLLDSRRKQ